MFRGRRIGGFVVRLILLYALLVAPWPGWRQAYAFCFQSCGNQLFRSFGTRGSVRFRPPTPRDVQAAAGAPLDLVVLLRNTETSSVWLVAYNTRYSGYLPTAAVIALVLATPVPWRRRGAALGWGLVLVNGFVAVRVALSLLFAFRNVGLFLFRPFWQRAVSIAYEAVSISTVTSIVVPALIWLLVTFRRDDWPTFGPKGALALQKVDRASGGIDRG